MGERVRSLRRSAGLSQEELAAGRFSKEYVSQIERGKTRPTAETLEWLAERLATDREFLEHGLTLADAERLEAALGDAERILEDARYADALQAFRGRSRAGRSRRLTDVLARLLLGEAWAHIRLGELAEAMALLERRPHWPWAPGSPTSTARRSCSGSASSATRSRASPRRSSSSTRRSCWRRAPTCPPIACARTSSTGVRAVIGATATGSPPRRTSSARWSWPRRARTLAGVRRCALPGVARRPAAGAVGARPHVRRAGARAVRGAGRPRHGGSAAEQPRGAEPPPRRLRSRDRAARGGLRDVRRPRPVGRRGLCVLVARRDPARSRRCGARGETQARKALDLLAGRVDHLQEIGMAQLTLGRALAARRGGSTTPRSGSQPPTRRSCRRSRRAIAATHGSRRATSRPGAATTRLQPASIGELRLRSRRSCSAGSGRRDLPPRAVAGDRVGLVIQLSSSCRRTSPRQDWRGGRRVPSARRRDSAYFPW